MWNKLPSGIKLKVCLRIFFSSSFLQKEKYKCGARQVERLRFNVMVCRRRRKKCDGKKSGAFENSNVHFHWIHKCTQSNYSNNGAGGGILLREIHFTEKEMKTKKNARKKKKYWNRLVIKHYANHTICKFKRTQQPTKQIEREGEKRNQIIKNGKFLFWVDALIFASDKKFSFVLFFYFGSHFLFNLLLHSASASNIDNISKADNISTFSSILFDNTHLSFSFCSFCFNPNRRTN